MKKILILTLNDFKHVFRDRMLTLFLFIPVLLILFVKYFVAYITEVYPEVTEFHPQIMMMGCIQTSIMFGFITGFMILEEKDEHVLQAIRVLPISSGYFILYRFLFAFVFSVLGAYSMILFGEIAWPGYWNALLLALQYGLAAPFISLVISTYAKNKVEGLALFKGINLMIILPILSFIFPGVWKYFLSFIPMFWTYQLYDNALNHMNTLVIFFIGLFVYVVFFVFLNNQFKQKVFNT
jgi:fluoroquinolone transport system permease protein